MWRTSLLEEKLADDLGNVIEGRAESVVVSQIFLQRQIGAEQFETFSTASTQTGQKPRQNPALQRAPDLISPNPLSCRPGKGKRMHFDRLRRRDFIRLVGCAAISP